MNDQDIIIRSRYSNPTRLVATETYDPSQFYTPIYILSAVFGIIFILGPLFVKRSDNSGIIKISIMLAAFTMWLLWVSIYIAQLNPLMGPRMKNTTLAWIAYSWGDPAKSPTPPGPQDISSSSTSENVESTSRGPPIPAFRN